MRLLINLSTLGARPTGLGVYAARCAQAACAAFDADLVASAGYRGEGKVLLRAPPDIALGAGPSSALRRWAWARQNPRFDGRVVYSPTHHALSGAPGQILTVHDLIALRFPRQHPAQYLFFRHLLPRQLERCRAVFTVSETSRHDIHETFGVPLEAIHVVPNGVDAQVFRQVSPAADRQPFLLMVGAAFPHKNVDELLDIATLWKNRYRLVVVSCRGRYRAHLEQRARQAGLQGQVRFVDYVSEAELVRLYQTCAAFVYPSKWEGFGIPPLEALACGASVIASDIPAHREVLGGHATFVQLGSAASWEHALSQLSHGHVRPAAKGDPPQSRFSWSRSAEILVRTLIEVEPKLRTSKREPS